MNDAWIGIAGVVIGTTLSSLTAAVSMVAGRRHAREERRRAFHHETLLALEQSLTTVTTMRFHSLAPSDPRSADPGDIASSVGLSFEASQVHVTRMGQLASRIGDVELMTAIADLAEAFATAAEQAPSDDRVNATWSGVLHAMIPVTHRVGQLLRDGL